MQTLTSAGRPRGGARAMVMVARRVATGLLRRRGVMRERRQLGELLDYLLEDIGLTHAEARREARRAFWDLPVTTFRHW